MAGAGTIRAGKAAVEIGITDKFSNALKKAQAKLSAFGASVAKIGAGFLGIGTAIAAPLGIATKMFATAGDQLDKMSQRTGFSVEELGRLGFAAEQSGTSIESLENGLRRMQRTISDAGKGMATAVDSLGELGIDVEKLASMSPEDQFRAIATQLAKVEDPTKRAALAMEIFGRSGTALLPMLSSGIEGMDALRDQADSLGIVMDTKASKSAALLTDTVNILRRVLRRTAQIVGESLAPAIIKALDRIVPIVVAVNKWVAANKRFVLIIGAVALGAIALGGALVFLGTSAIVLGLALAGLASAIGVGVTVLGAMATAATAVLSPIGLAVVAVVGLGAAILKWSGLGGMALDWLKGRFGDLSKFVGGVVGGISDALAAGDIQLAAQVLWAGLRVVWETGANELNKVWLGVRNFFVTTAQRMWFGAQAAFYIFADAIGVDWVELIAFMGRTLTNFGSGFKSFMEGVVSFVAKRLVDLQGLFDDTVDTTAIKGEIDVQTQQKQAEIEADRRARLFEIEENRETRKGETLDDALARVGAEFAAAQQALDDATGASVGAAQKRLDDARAALEQAQAEARQRRNELPDGGLIGRSLADFTSELDDSLRGVSDRTSAQGTFSAFAARGLVVGSDAEQRTAKATEKIEQTSKAIESLVRGLGLSFG